MAFADKATGTTLETCVIKPAMAAVCICTSFCLRTEMHMKGHVIHICLNKSTQIQKINSCMCLGSVGTSPDEHEQ